MSLIDISERYVNDVLSFNPPCTRRVVVTLLILGWGRLAFLTIYVDSVTN